MTTKLEKELKREIMIDDQPYTITIGPVMVKLVQKGRRNGVELAWKDLVSGQSASPSSVGTSMEQMNG